MTTDPSHRREVLANLAVYFFRMRHDDPLHAALAKDYAKAARQNGWGRRGADSPPRDNIIPFESAAERKRAEDRRRLEKVMSAI